MYFVPIKVENSSQSGSASGQNVRAQDKEKGQFGFFLSEFLDSKNDAPRVNVQPRAGTDAGQHTVSNPEQIVLLGNQSTAGQETHQISRDGKALLTSIFSLKNLSGVEQTKISQLLARILEFLKGDAKGQQLLQAWEKGGLHFLIPVKIKNGDTNQASQGFLLIQPDSKTPKNQLSEKSTTQPSFHYNLLIGEISGGVDNHSLAKQTGLAGEFQIQNGQVQFKPLEAGNGKIPLLLFANRDNISGKPFMLSDSGQSQQSPEEFIKAGRIAAQQQGTTNAGSRGQSDIASAKLVYIPPNHGETTSAAATAIKQGQTLGKSLSGEIAGLLESLKGEMKVKVTTAKGTGKITTSYADGKSQRPGGAPVTNHASLLHTQKKISSEVQPAQNTQQADQAESSFAREVSKNIRQEFVRLDSNQLSEGQNHALNQLMQKPTAEVFANGQPKAPMFQVIQKIEAMVQAAKAQRSLNQPQVMKAQLVLHPKHLGSVHLNLQYHDDTLSGTILAASKETKMLIEHSLQILKQALHVQHTAVNHLEVEVRSELSQQENAQNWFLQEHSNQQQRRGSKAEYQSEDVDPVQHLSQPDIIPATRTPNYIGNGRLELYA